MAALGLATIYTSVRAGRRALIRLRQLPPEAFGINPEIFKNSKINYHIGGFDHKMTIEEAKLILGVRDLNNMSVNDVHKKHRTTMLANHPDKGGSPYIAMKVNEARDVLENSVKKKHSSWF